MKNLFKLIAVLFFLTATTNIFSQTAYVKWPLTSDQNPDAPVGNIQASPESIGTGSGSYLLSIFNPYVANGQRLWTGNQGTGWIAGLPDYTRFIQFDASPTSGNDFTVQYISFRYSDNPLSTDFNILKSEVWYSTDGWNNKTQLNTTALNYLNTSVQTFSNSMNVLVQNGQTFSLRIYPYAPNGGSSMTQSWATHKDVLIEGTTSPAVLNNGSICGMKFNDLNGNGLQDQGELGLANWVINLSYQQATGTVTLADTTDENGNYCFNNLNSGITYTLLETNQTGWQQTFPSTPGTHTITLTSGQQIDSLNFGNMRLPLLGSICGIKFNDLNDNGLQDQGELGLANWVINLSYEQAAGTVTLADTTDENGNYCFNNLASGAYTVSEVQQSGWTQTAPTPNTYSITLSAGQNMSAIDFGNKANTEVECVDPPAGMVAWWPLDETSGTTSLDLAGFNNAGTRMNGPLPVAGKVLMGLQFDGVNDYIEVPDHSELNFGTGNFSIDAWIQTNENTGQKTILNKIQFPLNQGYSLYLSNGEVRLILAASSPVFYVSSVHVADGNWHHIAVTVDRADPSGIKFYKDGIMISTADPTTNPGTITAISPLRIGSLSFTVGDLFKGSLDEIELFNRVLSSTEIQSIYNAGSAGKCKPVPQLGSICGIKIHDKNGDGIKDSNEDGLSNWTINLFNGTTTISTTTDANGNYCFNDLPAGTYTVSEANQPNWRQIFPPQPGNYTITLTAGQIVNNINFSNVEDFTIELGSICGIKFNDLNGDGIQDLNEAGLPNWIINLSYANAAGSITLMDTTDANGNYCFNNLTPGVTYTLSETNQEGWQQTFPNSPGTHIVVLSSGQQVDRLNFGNKEQPAVGSDCTDFENGTGGWTTNNAGSTIIQEGENHYIQTTDQSGSSSFYNESKPLTGNWSEFLNGGCGTLCWDVNYIFAGIGNDGSSQPNTVTPYISIQGNGFSAYFLTNNLITAGDGWHSYCAPLQLINPGDPLPSNSDGHWVMSVGTSSDWNSMLTNITRLAFSIDPTSYQGEKFGFDNICLNNIGDCGTPTEFCDSLSATAVKTSPDDCKWSLSLNQPSNLTGVSSIQILSLAPNQFTTGTGLGTNFQNWFTTGTNTYTSPSGTITGGNLNNFFNVNLSYVTSPQVVVVNWLNESGTAVCTDTLRLNCEIPCATIEIDTVACAGSNYNLSYSFTNNAAYSVSNIEYTLQGTGNVSITPLTAQLSLAVLPGANSGLQNILISGAVSGDIVNILVKFNSPDGCCWCYETISVTIPTCTSVCDSLSVQAQGNPEDCCYSVSLTNNSSTVFSNVEFELISGGMFSTVSTTSSPGWGFTNVFPNNIIKLVKFPLSGGIANGSYSNVLDMCIRQYTSPNQVVAVRWIKDGQVVCTDTLMFECAPLETKIDSCSQAINGILTCLPDGTYKYDFRVQNNSNIMSTGYGIYPTTPGVTFSQTIFNVSIMPGQVSPVTSIIITGIGSSQNLCFQTAIFTVVPGENAYNYCCHSDTMCVTTPNCERQTDCIQPPTGMVAWWSLDETSGTTSNDLAGFNNAGTQINGPVPVAGNVLSGLQFDGINDYIEVPDHSELNFGTGNFSIDAWIQTNENTGQKTILNKIQFPLNQGYSLYLSNGEVRLILAASSPVFYVSSVQVADGNWHHIAVTVDRADPSGIKFYKDGIMISTADPTTNPGTITAISPLRIGSLSFTVGDLFKGSLDEIELFNRVLTPQEVNSIYSAGSAGKCKPTTDIKESEKIPEKFDLMQCYPNPFNPSTTISYNIPRISFVKIAVYDILGKEIRVLVNEAKSPGQYEILFDAKGLSSGIYFYVIRTGEFTQSKKMILMK